MTTEPSQHNALTFRPAAVADFAAVLALATQLAAQIEESAPPLTVAQFQKYFLAPHAPMRLLLAVDGNRVVGMISWTLTQELYSAHTRVYISDVAVNATARRRGIGAALMEEVKAWAQAHGASKIVWEVWYRNFAAKTFYEKFGASIDHEAVPYVLTIAKPDN